MALDALTQRLAGIERVDPGPVERTPSLLLRGPRRQVRRKSEGRLAMMPPERYIELDVTYRCNCRCQMCQRWKDPRGGELSVEELKEKEGELKQDQFNLRIQKATGQLGNTATLGKTKKDLARLKTVLRELEISSGTDE